MNKEAWKAARDDLDVIEKERDALIEVAVAPIRERYEAAKKKLELVEVDCPELLSRCEGCSLPIWEGERYHYDGTNGIYLCEPCAPAYSDMVERPDCFMNDDGEPMTAAEADAIVAAHIAAGGKAGDKMVSA